MILNIYFQLYSACTKKKIRKFFQLIGQHICTFLSKKTLVLRRRRKHGFLNIQTPASGPACITGMQLCKRRRSINTFVNDQYYEIIWYHQMRQFRQQQLYGDRCLMCTMLQQCAYIVDEGGKGGVVY